MQTTYDFILQSLTPGDAVAPETIEAAIAQSSSRREADVCWVLTGGEVVVRRVLQEGKVLGVELRVPLSDRTDLVREAVARGYELATQLGLQLIDPQLGRAVRPEFGNEVEDSFLRSAKYAGEYLGVSAAIGASFEPPREDGGGMSVATTLLLGAIVFVLVAFIVFRALLP